MNMKLPGFTAESALYKSRAVYAQGGMAQGRSNVVRAMTGVSPVGGMGTTVISGGPSTCCSSCARGDEYCLSKCSNYC